jgi:transposase-like protein
MARNGYPLEFRRRVVELVEGGRKVAEVAEDLGISAQSIYTWRRQARIDAGVDPGLTTAEKAELVAARKRIYVLGGTAVVAPSVAEDLRFIAPVTRLAGPDRYATAAAVCADTFGSGPVPSMAYIATGRNFPDGLTAGPVAGIGGSPILLVNRDTIPAPTRTELEHLHN